MDNLLNLYLCLLIIQHHHPLGSHYRPRYRQLLEGRLDQAHFPRLCQQVHIE